LRIAHVNDIAHVASVLALGQRRRGDVSEVFEPAKPGGSIPYPWKLVTFPLRAISIAAAVKEVRQGRFDIAHVHYATHAPIGWLTGLPWVLHCHGSDVRGVRRGSPVGRYLATALRGARAVLYSTVDLGEWVKALRRDALYLPNPIDTETFRPLGEPGRDILVGVRLDPIKGGQVVIDAIARLRQQRPATSFTVIADGSLAAAAQAAAGPNVVILPHQAHDAMPALFANHRAAIGQFHLGAIGQYELEAMASGTPVVANLSSVDGYRDPPPVVRADTGLAAAAAMVALLDDKPRRLTVAREGRDWVVANHAVAAVVDRLAQIYGEVLQLT